MRIRTLLATVAATAAAAIAIPVANAAPGPAVVFGDSLPANPSVHDYLGTNARLPLPDARANEQGCGTDFRFSNAYGRGSQNEVLDYTCAGASFRSGGQHISQQVQAAIDNGALNAGTREIVILAGANDTYPYIINERMPVPQVTENLRIAVRDTINAAKAAAPNANIKLVGYPSISDPDGNVCIINPGPGAGLPTPLVNIREIEDGLQNGVAMAAADTGTQFVDLKGVTAGHHTCSDSRWMVGVVDGTPGSYNLIVHMTDEGLDAIGEHTGRS